MNAPNGKMKMRVLTVAVQGALFAMFALPAHAEDPDVAALTTPDNFVEIGVSNVSNGSAKFGEYTGLNKNGAELIGNFSVKGGDAYGPGEGTTRWSVSGRDLGLTSRELGATISSQGRWNVGIGYDELRHNTTDGYQTPYVGSMGGNSFTLPASFAGNTANTTTLTAAQLASFHTVEVNNTRKNTSFDVGYVFSPEWRLTLDYNNLKQSGAKLMAFGSDATLGTLGSAGFSYTTNGGQRVSILPNPTDYTTDTVNLALDWTGDKGHASVGYYGSFFRDHYDRVSWETFGTNAAHQMNTMSTAPNNNLHQFNLSGGYRFSPETKLTGSFSRGRNTQNSSFLDTNLMFDATPLASRVALPASSLNGLVVTTHADVKLVNQTTKDLKLAASVKYDKRDNRTQSNIYDFYAINGTGDRATYPNTPYSNSKTQIELAGDYRLTKNNKIRVAYNHDDTDRWCNNYAVNAGYPAGTNCLVNTGTKEDKLSLGYKLKASDAVDFSAGYAYGVRKTTYDTNARTAFIGVKGGIVVETGVQAQNIPGLNGGDYPGFHPLFDASRKQQTLKAGANWQADDKLSFGVNGRYTDDEYTDATFGAQDGNSWNLNLDATYNYSDDGSVFGFISQDYRERYIKHANSSAATRYIWGDRLKDEGITYGLGFKQGGLMAGKLDLKGDFNFSDSKSTYSSDFITWIAGATTAATCAAANSMTCGTAPAIKNKLTQFKLTGTYTLDKQSKVALGYAYQRLSSTDYFYNSYQYGYTATSVLPTNQQSGSYSVNMIAASYIYSFK